MDYTTIKIFLLNSKYSIIRNDNYQVLISVNFMKIINELGINISLNSIFCICVIFTQILHSCTHIQDFYDLRAYFYIFYYKNLSGCKILLFMYNFDIKRMLHTQFLRGFMCSFFRDENKNLSTKILRHFISSSISVIIFIVV